MSNSKKNVNKDTQITPAGYNYSDMLSKTSTELYNFVEARKVMSSSIFTEDDAKTIISTIFYLSWNAKPDAVIDLRSMDLWKIPSALKRFVLPRKVTFFEDVSICEDLQSHIEVEAPNFVAYQQSLIKLARSMRKEEVECVAVLDCVKDSTLSSLTSFSFGKGAAFDGEHIPVLLDLTSKVYSFGTPYSMDDVIRILFDGVKF